MVLRGCSVHHSEQLPLILADALNESPIMSDLLDQENAAYSTWVEATDRRTHAAHPRLLINQLLEYCREGIMVTDEALLIVSVNRAFTQITGYTANEVIGRSASILKPGIQDEIFYQSMWKDIQTQGCWEGEVWNRHKLGHTYPEWLSVSAVLDENGRVHQYLGIFSEITAQKTADAHIHRLTNYDALTGLPNQNLLADRARVALSAAQRSNESVAVMHVNLDHFRGINESLGHEAGNHVLAEVARRLSADARTEDTVSRMGGDNFIVLLPGTTTQGCVSFALRIMASVSRPMRIRGHDIELTTSIGIATYPDNGSDLLQLTQSAECAIHQAKREGRQQLQLSSQCLQDEAVHAMTLERELRHAVERQQLVLHYQPQVDIATGRIVGMEALVRWMHPEWGMVPPLQFIPIAESIGVIRDIGKWVLRTATLQCATWIRQGLPEIPVAVNLSMAQFRDKNLHDFIQSLLNESAIPPKLLELELTESIAMSDTDCTTSTIDALKKLGVILSIDDFGTGHSSLSRLTRLPFDKLKIDKSFIRSLHQNPKDDLIVQTIISLAKCMGMKTIAEGVETLQQLAFLNSQGCEEFQGFLFSKPVSADQFEQLLRHQINTDAHKPTSIENTKNRRKPSARDALADHASHIPVIPMRDNITAV